MKIQKIPPKIQIYERKRRQGGNKTARKKEGKTTRDKNRLLRKERARKTERP